jgi:hypothetical protein
MKIKINSEKFSFITSGTIFNAEKYLSNLITLKIRYILTNINLLHLMTYKNKNSQPINN